MGSPKFKSAGRHHQTFFSRREWPHFGGDFTETDNERERVEVYEWAENQWHPKGQLIFGARTIDDRADLTGSEMVYPRTVRYFMSQLVKLPGLLDFSGLIKLFLERKRMDASLVKR